MSTSNFQTEEEFKEYLDELGIQYHYACFRENTASSCHLLGDWYVMMKKYKDAVKQYTMTCDKYDFPRSCYKSGLAHFSGERAEDVDLEKAIQYFKRACDLGEPEGCFMSGIALKQGNFPFDALSYFEKHCLMNHHSSEKGCYQASVTYLQGPSRSSIPKDFKKAFEFSVKGCELGNARCCLNLGLMYRNGDGIPRDDNLANQFQKKGKDLMNLYLPKNEKIQ